jgi:mono/diheme cytochrome c family protein
VTLRLVDRGLAAVSWLGAVLVVVLLFAGPSLIGAKKSGAASPYSTGVGGQTTTSGAQSSGSAAQSAGKAVFASAGCGSCHTLKDAGATGAVGPNLDDLRPDAGTVSQIVKSGGGAMPSFSAKLSDAQIAAVASYVSSVAGH